MNKDYLLFDLDGTLTDPQEGITNSVAYALEYYGIHVEEKKDLCKFIGPPLKDSFMEYYGFSQEKAEEAVWKYREYFGEKGLLENRVYEGIPRLLAKLKEEGKTLIVATSKPTLYARQILDHFELSQYFSDIQGSTMDGSRVKKGDVIAYALKENQIQDKSRVLMIGDREHDILGAHSQGIQAVGVLFGFGSREEFVACGAEDVAETVEDLKRILASWEG